MTDIVDYLSSLKASLETRIVDFQAKYSTLPQGEIDLLANIEAILAAEGTSGGGLTPVQAKTATKEAIEEATNLVDLNTKLNAIATQSTLAGILTQLQGDLGVLKTNTGKISQYQIQLAEDATNTVFIVRFDSVSGATANFTLSGASYSPTAPIQVVPDGSNLEVQTNEFEAITTSAGNWTIGDILTRISIVNTSSNAVSSIWQSASGATLSTIPVIGTDVIDTDKRLLEVFTQILLTLQQDTNPLINNVENALVGDDSRVSSIDNSVQLANVFLNNINNKIPLTPAGYIPVELRGSTTTIDREIKSAPGYFTSFATNYKTAVVQVSGNFTGVTLVAESFIDNAASPSTLNADIYNYNTKTWIKTITSPGIYLILNIFTDTRLRLTAIASGTIAVESKSFADSLITYPGNPTQDYINSWTAIASYASLTTVAATNTPPSNASFVSIPYSANSKCREIELFANFLEVTNAPNSLLVALWALPDYDTVPYLVGLFGYSAGENRANILVNAFSAVGTTFVDLKQDLSQLKLFAQVLADTGTISVAYDFTLGQWLALNNGISTTTKVKCSITSNDSVPRGLGVNFGTRLRKFEDISSLTQAFTTDYQNNVDINNVFAGWDGIILNTSINIGIPEYLPQEGISGRCYNDNIDVDANEILIENCGFDLTLPANQRIRFRNASFSVQNSQTGSTTLTSATTTYYLINVRKIGSGINTQYAAQVSINGITPYNIVGKGTNGYFYIFPVGKFKVYLDSNNLYSKNSFVPENLLTRDLSTLVYNVGATPNIWTAASGAASTITATNTYSTSVPEAVRMTATTMPTGVSSGQLFYTIPSATTGTTTQLSYKPGGKPISFANGGTGVRLTRVSDNSTLTATISTGTITTYTLNGSVVRNNFAYINLPVSIYSATTGLLLADGFVLTTATNSISVSEREGGQAMVLNDAGGVRIVTMMANSISNYQREFVDVLSDVSDESLLIYSDTANNAIALQEANGVNVFILQPANPVQVRGAIKVRGVNF
jgi:hypothetical protein